MKTTSRWLPVLVCVAATQGAALAQGSWPTRPVRIMVPYAAGGVTDTVARIVAPKIQEALGQPVIIENKLGAGGTLATEFVAKATPDGYTLLMGSAGPQTLAQFIQKVGYDGLKSFAPVSNANTNPLVLMVHPSVAARSVRELVDLAKKQPGKLNFGSGGAGGLTHFSGEIFKFMTGIDIVHVPYKGGAPATAAALSGEVQITFANYSDAIAQMKAGRLIALGITSTKRFPQSPDVPTIAEAGVPGYGVDSWNGLFAPAGTPPEVVKRISEAMQRTAKDAGVQQRMADIGCEPVGDTPEHFRAFVQAEMQKWGSFVKQSGIRIDP